MHTNTWAALEENMRISFEGPTVLVRDINASRRFYETVLGQELLADHGPHLAFRAGFFLWQADGALPLMRPGAEAQAGPLGRDNFEMYFECAELDEAWAACEAAGAPAAHPIVEQPWGQRGFRVLDPDGHVVEVAEPLSALVRRLMAQGLDAAAVAERTSIPLGMVRELAGERD
ncbi:MAG: VOC family protein [Desulfovibrionaceae bacterium]